MPRAACTTCGKLATPGTKRCAEHGGNHTGRSPNRDRQAQHHFRQALLARAGHQCEAVDDGVRCAETTDLRATHLTPVRDGGSYHPDNGLLLCKHHDKATDPYAR